MFVLFHVPVSCFIWCITASLIYVYLKNLLMSSSFAQVALITLFSSESYWTIPVIKICKIKYMTTYNFFIFLNFLAFNFCRFCRSLHLFSYLNSWERASIFPFWMFSAKQGHYWYIFIRSLVWRGPWLGIEPGTSCTRCQHYTTRLSRSRSHTIKLTYW